jgi:hypothetical protein
MVSYDVNRIRRTFEIFPPSHKGLPNGQEFLVVGIVVQFSITESTGVKCNRVNVVIRSDGRDYSGNCIVRSIGFDDERSIQNEMGENRSRVESGLEFVEGGATLFGEIPLLAFAGKTGKWQGNIRVGVDEYQIEITETK